MDGPYRSLVVGWKAEVGLECANRTYGKSDQNPSITKRWCHIWKSTKEAVFLSTIKPYINSYSNRYETGTGKISFTAWY